MVVITRKAVSPRSVAANRIQPQSLNGRLRPFQICDTEDMLTKAKIALLAAMICVSTAALCQYSTSPRTLGETGHNTELSFPEHYREWVYLSSGFDMSYRPNMPADHHMFDNVFVNPEAYKAFLATGTWPDKTMLVLEVREAHGRGSINQRGNFQGEAMDVEVHVKDASRFPGQWAFFAFANGKAGKLIPTTADCYSCHAEHGAVDTTFVQFYPTLLPVAKREGTVRVVTGEP
jgi:hypothetical protein